MMTKCLSGFIGKSVETLLKYRTRIIFLAFVEEHYLRMIIWSRYILVGKGLFLFFVQNNVQSLGDGVVVRSDYLWTNRFQAWTSPHLPWFKKPSSVTSLNINNVAQGRIHKPIRGKWFAQIKNSIEFFVFIRLKISVLQSVLLIRFPDFLRSLLQIL